MWWMFHLVTPQFFPPNLFCSAVYEMAAWDKCRVQLDSMFQRLTGEDAPGHWHHLSLSLCLSLPLFNQLVLLPTSSSNFTLEPDWCSSNLHTCDCWAAMKRRDYKGLARLSVLCLSCQTVMLLSFFLLPLHICSCFFKRCFYSVINLFLGQSLWVFVLCVLLLQLLETLDFRWGFFPLCSFSFFQVGFDFVFPFGPF